MALIAPIVELERALSKLPGFGRRSAARAALALVREQERLLKPLVVSLNDASARVRCCSRCGAFTTVDADPCAMCTDSFRENGVLCVVEEPADIVSIEASGGFNGRYHALGGKISIPHRTDPGKLRLAELRDRVVREGFAEVMLAISTDMDGDATVGYIVELLRGTGAKISRLAFGLPADSGVAYSDPLTLKRAIRGRIDA